MAEQNLVSIFIPVFNGEKFLEKTLLSIRNQTYLNFEVLLVDDSSTDSSQKIIEEFVKEDFRFKLFVKLNGAIAAKSWNFVLPKLKGIFVFYSSQDDLFSEDLLEKMILRQNETKAEIVLPDLEFYFENVKNNSKIIGLNDNRNQIISGKQACTESLNWTIHGFGLYSKTLFVNEIFPENAFDSDEFMTRKLFLKSNTIAFSEGTFFYRQDNPNAITKTFSKKNFYSLNTLQKLHQLLIENDFDKIYVQKSKFELYRKFLFFSAAFLNFKFDSENDKEEIRLFLNDYKVNYLSKMVLKSEFPNTLLLLKTKILVFVLGNSFLFKMAVWIEGFRIKGRF